MPPHRISTVRVLVADLDPHVRGLLRSHLAQGNFECREAVNGEEAVRLAIAFRPHVVLLDVEADEAGGYEAARRLSRSVLCPRPWLVAMTTQRDDVRALEAGFDLLLAKPLQAADVMAMLRACSAAGPVESRTD